MTDKEKFLAGHTFIVSSQSEHKLKYHHMKIGTSVKYGWLSSGDNYYASIIDVSEDGFYAATTWLGKSFDTRVSFKNIVFI